MNRPNRKKKDMFPLNQRFLGIPHFKTSWWTLCIYISPTRYSIQFLKKNTCVGISRNIPIFVGWILWLSTAWSIRQVASASVGWLHMLGQQISVGVLPRLQGAKRHGIMGNSQSRSINHLWKIIYRWIIIYKSMHQLGGFDGKIIYKSRFLAEIPKWRFFSLGNPHRTPKTPWRYHQWIHWQQI